jgi:hypothetical protein
MFGKCLNIKNIKKKSKMEKINKILLEFYDDRKQLLVVSILGYISYLVEGIMPSNPHVIQATGVIIGAVVVAGAGIYMSIQGKESAGKANELAEKNMQMQNKIAQENLKFQKEEAAKLEKQKDVYRNMEFKNPYENMENVYEDLTVDQGQAQFQKQMFQQSQANIMQDLKGAAGGSGIAGLAQALAGQGQLASQQASISIGQQERANKMAQLGEERNIDLMYRQGEASVDEKEMNRQSTLLGMQMGQLTGANNAVAQSQQNQMAAGAAQANMYGQQAASQQQAANQMFSTAGNLFGSIPGGG